MVTSTAITQAILSFHDLEDKLGRRRTHEPNFFPEWQMPLPDLTWAEREGLNRLSQRYLTYLEAGEVSEGTLNIILLAPLLDILGLCDSPYRIRGEMWVEVQTLMDTETGRITLEGRIDALTIQDHFWLVVIEGKRSDFSVLRAVPQAMAYMSATPNEPIFGLATNGYDYLFIKLAGSEFGLSDNFNLLSGVERNLLCVAQVLKHLVNFHPTNRSQGATTDE